MEFFNVLSVEDTKKIIEDLAKHYKQSTEIVSLENSLNRVVAVDVISKVNLPAFNRSTVDGYAVYASDVMGASESIPSFLTYNGEVKMGEFTDKRLEYGEAIYVPTGGMVPDGAEGVVMVEYSEKVDDDTILIHQPIAPGEHITYIGDDLKKDKSVIEKGKRISPYDIGVLAGIGISEVEVVKKPVFSILSTGDEIIDINEKQEFGKIRDINGYALKALVKDLGGEVNSQEIVKDDFELLKSTLGQMLAKSDVVMLSGGSSVGVRDYTKQLIESFDDGEVLVHGVSVKPGKPTIIGKVENKIVFGLPGHPSSALMIFNVFVKHYINQILSRNYKSLLVDAIITKNIHSAAGKETYQMVELEKTERSYLASPIYAKSGMMTMLSKSIGYIRISDDAEGVEKGDKVCVNLLQEVYL